MQHYFKHLSIILLLSLSLNLSANSESKKDTTDRAKSSETIQETESTDLEKETKIKSDSVQVYVSKGKTYFQFVLKDTTRNRVDSLVKGFFSLLKTDKKSEDNPNKSTQTNQDSLKLANFILSYWWAFLLLFILLLLLSWKLSSFLNQKRNLKSISSKTNKKFSTWNDMATEIINLQGSLSFQEQEYLKLIESIKRERDEAKNNLENAKKMQEKDNNLTLQLGNLIPPSSYVIETNTFYFSSAVRDGSNGFFVDENKTSTKLDDSQYKFEVNNSNPNVATFGFDAASSNFESILAYRSYKLEPVCKSINLFKEGIHTKIVHVEKGRAVLEDGKWIVRDSDKAKIKFE